MQSTYDLNLPTTQELSQMPDMERQLWTNKILVHDFFTQVINEHDLTAADRYLTAEYIQHNPGVPTGREGFKSYFANMFKTFPKTKVHVLKILAEGDEVVIYCEHLMSSRLTNLKMKTIDVFRVEDNLIAEHWDAVEGYGFRDSDLPPILWTREMSNTIRSRRSEKWQGKIRSTLKNLSVKC